MSVGPAVARDPAEALLFPVLPQSLRQAGDAGGFARPEAAAADAGLGVAALAARAMRMCDDDLQADLWKNLVCAGGTTLAKGFTARLAAEVGALAPAKVLRGNGGGLGVVPDPVAPARGYNAQRANAAWVGGSVLASLDTFGAVAVTKAEWDEHGESIVHRKGF